MLEKLKSLLPKKVRNSLNIYDSNTIYTNDHLNIVHRAARICVGMEPLTDDKAIKENVEKVISKGHESVLEHSNVIMYIEVPKKHYEDLLEIGEYLKYLNYKTTWGQDNIHLLIGGSIRGYKHIYRNIKNMNNYILGMITKELYITTESEYYTDLIDAGILDYNNFKFVKYVNIAITEDGLEAYVDGDIKYKEEDYNNFTIINVDDIESIYEQVKDFGFSYDDLLDMCTISILFKNVSRAISQQFTRHRVAISQESQRYVDYSKMKFIDPTDFKDKYEKDKLYEIGIEYKNYMVNTKQLANLLMNIYPQLRTQGMDKEDARGFIPFNVETKFIMTFTFRNLIKFLELRVDKAAQPEIRNISIQLEEYFINKLSSILGDDIYKYLLPKYTLTEINYEHEKIDEDLEIIEEVEEKTNQ